MPFPSPGDLPNPAIEPGSSSLAGKFFTTEAPGKPFEHLSRHVIVVDDDVSQKPTKFCKAIILQFKNKYIIFKKKK